MNSPTTETTPSPNPPILAAVLEALHANPLAAGFSDDALNQIACEAIRDGKLDDEEWLKNKLNSQQLDEATESIADIIVSTPLTIASQEELVDAINSHERWMDSVLSPKRKDKGDPTGPTQRANFRGADLSGYDLSGNRLRCADFRKATLVGANFTGSDLGRARFQEADLRGANFSNTNIAGAYFTGADLRGAQWEGVDLSKADFDASKQQKLEEQT